MSQRFTADIITLGERAGATLSDLEAKRFARDARPSAVDAANEAKSCGCTATLPVFEEIVLLANYADRAQNLTAAQQYGRRIKRLAETAMDTLRRCPGG